MADAKVIPPTAAEVAETCVLAYNTPRQPRKLADIIERALTDYAEAKAKGAKRRGR